MIRETVWSCQTNAFTRAIELKNMNNSFVLYWDQCKYIIEHVQQVSIAKRPKPTNESMKKKIKAIVYSYKLVALSVAVSSPSMRYTRPCITYSNWSARLGVLSNGLYSASSTWSSLNRVHINKRNLLPELMR